MPVLIIFIILADVFYGLTLGKAAGCKTPKP
jgi:hypothetical protein